MNDLTRSCSNDNLDYIKQYLKNIYENYNKYKNSSNNIDNFQTLCDFIILGNINSIKEIEKLKSNQDKITIHINNLEQINNKLIKQINIFITIIIIYTFIIIFLFCLILYY